MSVDVSPAAKSTMNTGNGTHSMEVRDVHKAFGPFEILTGLNTDSWIVALVEVSDTPLGDPADAVRSVWDAARRPA